MKISIRPAAKTAIVLGTLCSICYLAVYFARNILAANCASTILWSCYCLSLRDTGLVSGATGFLDFSSYMAASIASSMFPKLLPSIGWQ